MVAVIKSGKSLRNALNYNEQKVKKQQAVCLLAANYPKEADQMTFYQKLARLTNQAALNTRTTVNSVHISLNFDPSENLEADTLRSIAREYMTQIGFGKQPYLVYQHHDSGHPHLHVVTTNIQPDGKRISLHNLGRNESEMARKQIERDYHLVEASSKSIRQAVQIPAVPVTKILYGKAETKRAITNVLDKVLNQYSYSSLAELNAVLQLYNLCADRGSEQSRTHQKGGLVYRVLNDQGEKVGVPIKASSIYSKPTFSYLQERFAVGEQERKKYKTQVRARIDFAIHGQSTSWERLTAELQRQRISVVVRQNKQGMIYGLTYVDHQSKCVFNGSDLGKEYAAKVMLDQFPHQIVQNLKPPNAVHQQLPRAAALSNGFRFDQADTSRTPTSVEPTPPALEGKKRKRKRKLRL